MSTIEWPPLVMGGVKMADSHVGNTLLNRPWLQAIRDVEAGTPVAEVWMTEAEAEAYHLEHAGRVLAPAVKAAAIGGRWCGVQLQTQPGLRGPGNRRRGPCGGELLYRRRLEGERIVSYLICQFCGHQTPMLACDTTTGEHTTLAAHQREETP